MAAIWPEQLWDLKRSAIKVMTVPDLPVWQEYGLEAAEQAQYPGLKVTGYRLKDPTSALAVYQWLKPAGGRPTALEKTGVEWADRVFLLKGNYVLDFEGQRPTQQQVDILHVQLPRLDQSALPTLPSYLPRGAVIPGSERYILGPVALEKFYPGMPPSIAAFSLGAEAQVASYATPEGKLQLGIFAYPTPHIARDRALEYQKLPGAVVKRTGPLVAILLQPANPDEAEKLLAKVNYQVSITLNEKPTGIAGNPGDLLISIFMLTGILLGFTILGGVAYAVVLRSWRRWTGRPEVEPMVTLRISGRSS
jgi:hypothetical protein